MAPLSGPRTNHLSWHHQEGGALLKRRVLCDMYSIISPLGALPWTVFHSTFCSPERHFSLSAQP